MTEMMRIRLLTTKAQQFLMKQTEGLLFTGLGLEDSVAAGDNTTLKARHDWTKEGLLFEVLLPIRLSFLNNNKFIPFGSRIFVQLENGLVRNYTVHTMYVQCTSFTGRKETPT